MASTFVFMGNRIYIAEVPVEKYVTERTIIFPCGSYGLQRGRLHVQIIGQTGGHSSLVLA
jgi:hypothetical protein